MSFCSINIPASIPAVKTEEFRTRSSNCATSDSRQAVITENKIQCCYHIDVFTLLIVYGMEFDKTRLVVLLEQ